MQEIKIHLWNEDYLCEKYKRAIAESIFQMLKYIEIEL